MKMTKKLTVILTVILAVMVALTACGGSSTSTSDTSTNSVSEAKTEVETVAETEAPKVKITFANTWVREEMKDATYPLDLIEAYKKDNPNVEVTIDAYNSSNYQSTVFKTMAAAKNLPEMFTMNSMDYRFSVDGGLLTEWTDILNSDAAWKDSFLPGILNETTFDNKVYGIPMHFITNEVVFYNKDILKKAGYDTVPADWDGFLALCEKLKNDGLIPIAIGDKDGWPLCSNLMEIQCEYICGPEWVSEIGAYSGKASYDDPKFVSVLKLVEDFVKKGYVNDDMVSIDNNTQDKSYLYNGESAMLFGGSYTLAGVINDCPEELKASISVAPIPMPSNAAGGSLPGTFTGGSGWAYGINTTLDDNQKKACIDLIKIFTGPEYAKAAVEHNQIPVTKTDSLAGIDTSKVLPLQQEMNKLISNSPRIALMNQEQNGSMANIIYKKLQELSIGQTTPEQAAKDIQTAYAEATKNMAK